MMGIGIGDGGAAVCASSNLQSPMIGMSGFLFLFYFSSGFGCPGHSWWSGCGAVIRFGLGGCQSGLMGSF
jgi:hypothetical protein